MAVRSICFPAYDTICKISIAGQAARDADFLLSEARAIAEAVEDTLSMFRPGSELSVLCRAYLPGRPHPVSEMLYDFLDSVLRMAHMSEGVLDPTVAPLVKLWNFGAAEPRVPPRAEIERALSAVGYRRLTLDPARRAVRFQTPGMGLDPGSAGKGFALARAAAFLRRHGVCEAALDFGENLYVIGPKTDAATGERRPWKVALRHPEAPGVVLGRVPLQDAGIATSAPRGHCFTKNGRVYHHLLNPKTGCPHESALQSVSILSSNALFTDLLSTAFFLLGDEAGAALAERCRAESREQVDYVAMRQNGTVAASPGARFEPEHPHVLAHF